MRAERVDKPPLVVHIIYALGTGGLENGLVNIINRSPPERFRHAILCLTRADAFAARLRDPAVEVIELHKRPGHDPLVYWRLWRTLRRLRPAIVHTRNLAALETQLLGLVMPRCRRVHGEHGRDVNDLDGSNPRYRLLRRLLSPFIHRFVAVSRDLADWLVDSVGIPPARVTQVYNGVDQNRFAPVPADDVEPAGAPPGFFSQRALVLGSVGRLAAVKDQQLLVRALAQLIRQRADWRDRLRLLIVGEGPEREALERAAANAGVSDRVWLPGDREDIPALLRRMDIFLLPSLGEGISNTILEAMATGLPVIATAVGGNPELVESRRTGLLVPPGDARELAEAIATLADDPAMRRAMGQAGLERIRQDFTWRRTVEAYLGVYDELLGRCGANPRWAVD